jgi:uncharacterized protein GlcG (DUF336 family)
MANPRAAAADSAALDIDVTGGQFPIPIVPEERGMRRPRSLIGAVGLTAVSAFWPMARGDGLPTTHELPLALALAAATEAMATCEKGGYHVSVTVIDRAGQTKVQLHGDQAPPHTADSSRGKAYTVMSLGQVFRKDGSAELAASVAANPTAGGLAFVPGFLMLAGAVNIKVGDEVIGAIGVGGAPGGALDENCARAGLAKIAADLH